MLDMKFSPLVNVFALPLLLFLWLLTTPAAHSLVVDGLYLQEIAVIDQGDAERLRAYREGLTEVILKVTGEERWMQNGDVTRALLDAQSYVQEVTYRTDSAGVAPQTLIRVTFDRELIDRMLTAAGIPVWDRNRPSVLLWLTVQGADGQRELLGSDSEHAVLELVREFSTKRGVPILLPLMDVEDRRNLPVDIAWSLDEQAIRKASARYGADSVLSGRVLQSPTGDQVGLWQFLFRERVETFDSVERDVAVFTNGALNRVTAQLATHFALARQSSTQSDQRVTLRVEGVDDVTAYVGLLAYLQELSVVDSVSASLLDGSSLELDVHLNGSTYLFTEFISLGRDLVPDQLPATEVLDSFLYYRWVR